MAHRSLAEQYESLRLRWRLFDMAARKNPDAPRAALMRRDEVQRQMEAIAIRMAEEWELG